MTQLLAAPYSYFADANGAPLAGGQIQTYAAGTTTPKATYTDSSAGTPLSNPVILDSAGRAAIWLSGNYKIVVMDALGNIIRTVDNVSSSVATGDMNKSVYDPANIQEQLVGLTAVQSISNKTINLATNTLIGQIPLASGGTGVSVSDPIIQRLVVSSTSATTGSTVLPFDNTVPQITEGNEYLTLAITPKSSTNKLQIETYIFLANNAAPNFSLTAALFQDSTANALCASSTTATVSNGIYPVRINFEMAAGTTLATTFRIRAGSNTAGTTTFNGQGGAGLFGGVLTSYLYITEYTS